MDQNPTQRHARLMLGRSNPYQTLLALVVTAFFFIMFQHVPHDAERREVNPKFARVFMDEEIGIKVNGTLLRGVKKDHRKYYLPDSKLMFECFDGNKSIPYASVNNDFCDCADGSDEPGTSACPNGKFYCEPEHIYLPSSRVNDGLCDCCDGSDEWKGVTISPDFQLPEDSDEVERAPCRDVCHDYKHEKNLAKTLQLEGIAAKQSYVNAGIGKPEIYGKEGEYYKLSIECFMYKSPNYVYEICPYRNASQIGKDTWLIGSGGSLDISDPNSHKIIMPNGAQDHCPEEPRKTIIVFKCGPKDEVNYVSESQTCVYTVKFTSPAACPSQADES